VFLGKDEQVGSLGRTSVFSQTMVFEKHRRLGQVARRIKAFPFSKIVLEIQFSIGYYSSPFVTTPMSFEKKQACSQHHPKAGRDER